jgi:L-alanine-DL-glutamate epimerase-like enolase superfamily enzyme
VADRAMVGRARIEALRTLVCTVPTDGPEADGTFAWDSTTVVIVEAVGGGRTGVGYSYTDRAAAAFVEHALKPVVIGEDAFEIPRVWRRMSHRVRNIGRPGLAATAISAVDAALWDLKAKLVGLPLADLLGSARDAVPIYGSGGFTSYSDGQLRDQLGGWTAEGLRWVKMKIGTEPARDLARVRAARDAVGDAAGLFVDANGAYSRKEALHFAERFAELGVTWFEEPVSSDDLDGLRLLRDRGPGGMEIAAGEYGYTPDYFLRMLAAGAVDVLQADATRCLGVTGFLIAGALAEAHGLDLSGHCAPALHLHVACAVPRLRHLEWFHDHVRIEHMLFDGAPVPRGGVIRPDPSRPGFGLELKRADAARFAA